MQKVECVHQNKKQKNYNITGSKKSWKKFCIDWWLQWWLINRVLKIVSLFFFWFKHSEINYFFNILTQFDKQTKQLKSKNCVFTLITFFLTISLVNTKLNQPNNFF